MSTSDPLSDMFTRIMNSQSSGKRFVTMPSSKLKLSVCDILLNEGYIRDYHLESEGAKNTLVIGLKYYDGKPVIENYRRISKPSCRVYKSSEDLPQVLGGLGTSIISTPKGVMTGYQAKKTGHGGEVLCIVS